MEEGYGAVGIVSIHCDDCRGPQAISSHPFEVPEQQIINYCIAEAGQLENTDEPISDLKAECAIFSFCYQRLK